MSNNMNNYEDNRNNNDRGEQNRDFLEEIMIDAQKKLHELQYVNAQDIVDAFKDRDRNGNIITGMELRCGEFNQYTYEELSSESKVATIKPEYEIFAMGAFTTLSIKYQRRDPEINIIWNALQDFGKANTVANQNKPIIPMITITVVPFSLGGSFSMIATDPVFWALQPPSYDDTDMLEIRIMYESENVMFMQMPFVGPQEIIAKLKEKVAMEQYTEDMKAKDEEARRAFEEERKKFLEQYIATSSQKRYSFNAKVVKHTKRQ